jgi:hypothetical protein
MADLGATVLLFLSHGRKTEEYRLDAKSATQLSNALIVQAEKAAFVIARKPVKMVEVAGGADWPAWKKRARVVIDQGACPLRSMM